MGECGCCNNPVDKAWVMPRGGVVGVQIYPGCDYCEPVIGVDVTLFKSKKSVFLDLLQPESVVLTDDDDTFAINVGVLDLPSVIEEARELWKHARIGPGGDDYEDLALWLEDFGLGLLQGAIRRFQTKVNRQQAEER